MRVNWLLLFFIENENRKIRKKTRKKTQDSYYFLDTYWPRSYDSDMTREARAVVVGIPHHITQRGKTVKTFSSLMTTAVSIY